MDLDSKNINKPIVLVGMMGCGKSAVGMVLANHLNLPFYDVDAYIVKSQGRAISDIFKKEGEEAFRRMEGKAISEILSRAPSVIACGGGAFTRIDNIEQVKARGISIWIQSDVETIYARVKNNKKRPLLQVDDPKAALKGLIEKRSENYALADIHIENNHGIKNAVEKIIAALEEYNNSRNDDGK
tara:strand:+ start:911 stop:1465 length:555 start_codon:yes stop_codon:yes gene_type:complete